VLLLWLENSAQMATIDLFSDGDPVVEFQSSVLIDKDAEFVQLSVMGVEFTLRQALKKLDKDQTNCEAESRGESAIGTGHLVWDGGIAATKILEHADKLGEERIALSAWKDKSVLELGSGVGGLGGMAASLMGSKRVVVSDVPDLVKTLNENVQSFIESAKGAQRSVGNLTAAHLEWCNEDHMAALTENGDFDIAVCCDVLNTEPAVITTVCTRLPIPAFAKDNFLMPGYLLFAGAADRHHIGQMSKRWWKCLVLPIRMVPGGPERVDCIFEGTENGMA